MKKIHKSELSISNLLGLYGLGAIVLAGVVGYFVIRPTYLAAEVSKQQVVVVQAETEQLKILQQNTNTLLANYEEIKVQRDKIFNLLPDANEEENLLALINKVAKSSGVLFANFQPELLGASADDTGTYETYSAKLTISGTYKQVQNFMDGLEKSARFQNIAKATISAGRGGDVDVNEKDPSLGVAITLNAYYRISDNNISGVPVSPGGGQ